MFCRGGTTEVTARPRCSLHLLRLALRRSDFFCFAGFSPVLAEKGLAEVGHVVSQGAPQGHTFDLVQATYGQRRQSDRFVIQRSRSRWWPPFVGRFSGLLGCPCVASRPESLPNRLASVPTRAPGSWVPGRFRGYKHLHFLLVGIHDVLHRASSLRPPGVVPLATSPLLHLLPHRFTQPSRIGTLVTDFHSQNGAACGVGGQLHVRRRVETTVSHLHPPRGRIRGAYPRLTGSDLVPTLALPALWAASACFFFSSGNCAIACSNRCCRDSAARLRTAFCRAVTAADCAGDSSCLRNSNTCC